MKSFSTGERFIFLITTLRSVYSKHVSDNVANDYYCNSPGKLSCYCKLDASKPNNYMLMTNVDLISVMDAHSKNKLIDK